MGFYFILFALTLLYCSLSVLGDAPDLPEDSFVGTETGYVICGKQSPGEKAELVWLKEPEGSYTTPEGTWSHTKCSYGSLYSFRVSKAVYLKLLKRCQDKGYTTAQAANQRDGGNWRPFRVGDFITPYYYKTAAGDKGEYVPTGKIPPCNTGNITLPNDIFPGKTANPWVYCVKKGGYFDRVVTYWGIFGIGRKYLDVDGEYVTRHCPFGFMQALRVSKLAYDTVLKRCIDQGYETAQPSKDGDNWRVFQVGNYYAPSYVDGTKFDTMLIPECDYGMTGDKPSVSVNVNPGGDSGSCSLQGQTYAVGQQFSIAPYAYECKLVNGKPQASAVACLDEETQDKHKPGESWIAGIPPLQYVFQCNSIPGGLVRQPTQCHYENDKGEKASVDPGSQKVIGKATISCAKTGENQLNMDIIVAP